jgi:hypothetical protein
MERHRRYSEAYIDRILNKGEPLALAELTSIICSSPRFDRAAPDYGLPQFALAFVEGLCWVSQAVRSEAWTYYEATPIERQRAALGALRACARPDLADWYESGMKYWSDKTLMEPVQLWISAHERDVDQDLNRLLLENRASVSDLTA